MIKNYYKNVSSLLGNNKHLLMLIALLFALAYPSGYAQTVSVFPYQPAFTGTTQYAPLTTADWTYADVNQDGYTWGYGGYNDARCQASQPNTGTHNDWLISPGLELIAGRSYQVSYYVQTGAATGYNNAKMDVRIGTDMATTAMATSTIIDSVRSIIGGSAVQHIVTFVCPATGTYYLGFWANNTTAGGSNYISISSLEISIEGYGIPFFENFDGAAMPYDWSNTVDPATPCLNNTWALDNGKMCGSPSASFTCNAIDAYLFTPGLPLEAGEDYTLTFDYYKNTSTLTGCNLIVKIGTAPTIAAQTTTLQTIVVSNTTSETATIAISVPANGTYYISFFDYTRPQGQLMGAIKLYLDNVSIINEAANIPVVTLPYIQPFATGAALNDFAVVPDFTAGEPYWQYGGIMPGAQSVMVNRQLSAADAWLFTPAFALEAGKTYKVSCEIAGSPLSTENFRIALGNGRQISRMTDTLFEEAYMNLSGIPQTVSLTFTPVVSGNAVVGFNCWSPISTGTGVMILDNIVIEEYSYPTVSLPFHDEFSSHSLDGAAAGQWTDIDGGNAVFGGMFNKWIINSDVPTFFANSQLPNTVLDDWLISPAMTFEAGKTYIVKFGVNALSNIAEFSVTFGKGITEDDQTGIIADMVTFEPNKTPYDTRAYAFEVPTTDNYHIGFHIDHQFTTTSAATSIAYIMSVVDIYELEGEDCPYSNDFATQARFDEFSTIPATGNWRFLWLATDQLASYTFIQTSPSTPASLTTPGLKMYPGQYTVSFQVITNACDLGSRLEVSIADNPDFISITPILADTLLAPSSNAVLSYTFDVYNAGTYYINFARSMNNQGTSTFTSIVQMKIDDILIERYVVPPTPLPYSNQLTTVDQFNSLLRIPVTDGSYSQEPCWMYGNPMQAATANAALCQANNATNMTWTADAWLITPEFNFEASSNYAVRFKAWTGNTAMANLEVKLGTSDAPSSFTTMIHDLGYYTLGNLNGRNSAAAKHSYLLPAGLNGLRRVGFHCYSPSVVQNGTAIIDDIEVTYAYHITTTVTGGQLNTAADVVVATGEGFVITFTPTPGNVLLSVTVNDIDVQVNEFDTEFAVNNVAGPTNVVITMGLPVITCGADLPYYYGFDNADPSNTAGAEWAEWTTLNLAAGGQPGYEQHGMFSGADSTLGCYGAGNYDFDAWAFSPSFNFDPTKFYMVDYANRNQQTLFSECWEVFLCTSPTPAGAIQSLGAWGNQSGSGFPNDHWFPHAQHIISPSYLEPGECYYIGFHFLLNATLPTLNDGTITAAGHGMYIDSFGVAEVTIYQVTASVNGGNGTITPTYAEVAEGDDIEFTITPNYGYEIGSLTVNGTDVSPLPTGTTYTLSNVMAQTEVVATFQALPSAYCGGTGTQSDPYLICDILGMTELATFVGAGNSTVGMYYKLVANLNYGGTPNIYTPIGSSSTLAFKGHFDGDGHKISGINIMSTLSNRAAFGYVAAGATITNLHIVDYLINTTAASSGGMAGINYGTITNCSATGDIHCGIDASNAGGFVGQNLGTISNCFANVNVSAGMNCGGFVGNVNDGSITNCYSTGNVLGDMIMVGGFCGLTSSTISNCYSIGNVDATNIMFGIGGCVGYVNPPFGQYIGSADNCYSLNTAYTTPGGGVAMNAGQMQNPAFVITLNNGQTPEVWILDSNYINNGYPILSWQANSGNTPNCPDGKDVPYFYDFTDATEFDTQYTKLGTTTWARNTSSIAGNPVAQISWGFPTDENLLITPPFNLDPTKNYVLKYKLGKSSSAYDEAVGSYIGSVNDASIITSGTRLDSTSMVGQSGYVADYAGIYNWIQIETIIPSTAIDPDACNYIAFHRYYTNGLYVYVDDIMLYEEGVTTDPIVTLSTTGNGSVEVIEPAGATSPYTVDFGAPTTLTLTPTAGNIITSIIVNGNAVAIPSIFGCNFTIGAVLEDTEIDITFEPIPAYDAPYFYDFTNVAHFEEYTKIDVNGDGRNWADSLYGSAPAGAGRVGINFDAASSTLSNPLDWMITPPLNLDPALSYILQYKYARSNSYAEELIVVAGNGNTVVDMAAGTVLNDHTVFPAANVFGTASVTISGAMINPSGYTYIGFQHQSPGWNYYVYVDDIEVIEAIPTTVTLIVGPNGTATNAGVNNVSVGTSFTTVITPDAGYIIESITIDGVAQNPLTVSVKGGTWTSPAIQSSTTIEITFTEVPSYTPPYSYNFENVAHFDEYTTIDVNGDGRNWVDSLYIGAPAGAGRVGINFDAASSTLSNPQDWMITPPLNLDPAVSYILQYKYAKSTTSAEQLIVVAGNGNTVADMAAGTVLNDHTVFPGSNVFGTASVTISGAMINPSGYTYIGFQHQSPGWNFYVYVDDIEITESLPTTVELIVGPNGTATNTGVNDVAIGTSFTTVITPDAGYIIESITIDGVAQNPLTVSVQGGTWTSPVIQGPTIVEITFSPIPAYTLPYYFGWEDGDVVSNGSAYTYFFTEWTFVDGPGVNPWGRYNFLATPDEHFAGIQYNDPFANDDWMISPGIYLAPLPAKQIEISYSWITSDEYLGNQEEWDFTIGNSTAIASHTVLHSFDTINQVWQKMTFILDPSYYATAGNYFFGWHSKSNMVILTGIDSFSVKYIDITYQVTASINGVGGTITPTDTTVIEGEDVIFTITPDAGYELNALTVNGTSVIPLPTGTTYTLSNVMAQTIVVATFAQSGPCTGLNVPFYENFTTFADFEAWTVVNNDGGMTWDWATPTYTPGQPGQTYAYLTTPGALCYGDYEPPDGPGTNDDILISPAICLDDAETYELKYSYFTRNQYALNVKLCVYLMDGTAILEQLAEHIIASSQSGPIWWNNTVTLDGTIMTAPGAYSIGFRSFNTTNPLGNVVVDSISLIMISSTQYQVTASVDGIGGTITPTDIIVDEGDDVIFTITPDAGYELASLTVNSTPVIPLPTGTTWTLSNVQEDMDVVVTFGSSAACPGGKDVPYFYDFADGTEFTNEWTRNTGTTWALYTIGGTQAARSVDNAIYPTNHLVTPPFALDPAKNYVLKYKIGKNYTSATYMERLELYIGTTADETIIDTNQNGILLRTDTMISNTLGVGGAISAAGDGWIQIEQTISGSLVNGNGCTYFAFHSLYGGAYYYVIVDDVMLFEEGTDAPHTVTLVTTGNGTAEIVIPAGATSPYTVDFGEPTTLTLTPTAGNVITSITVNGNTVPIPSPFGCNFTIGAVMQDITLAVAFGAAPSYPIPYAFFWEDGDAVSNGNAANHFAQWARFHSSFNAAGVPIDSNWHRYQLATDNYTARAYYYIASNNAATAEMWMVTPPLEVVKSGNDYIVKFSYRSYSTGTSYRENMKIYISDGITADDTLALIVNVVDNITLTTTDWVKAVAVIPDAAIPASGNYHIAFKYYKLAQQPYSSYGFYVDSLEVIESSGNVNVTASVSGGNGTITPTDTTIVGGTNLLFTITPNVGYVISTISVNGVDLSPLPLSFKGGTWNMSSINVATNVVVTFEPIPSYDVPYFFGFADADAQALLPVPVATAAAHFDEYTIFQHATVTYRWTNNTTALAGNPVASLSYVPQTDANYMITPPLNLDPTKTYILRYKVGKSSTSYNEHIISYIGSVNNATILSATPIAESFLPSTTGYVTSAAQNFVLVEADIPQAAINPTGPSFIGFNRVYVNGLTTYIDDIEVIEAIPTTVTLTVGPNGTATNAGMNNVAIGTSFTTVITPDAGYIIESITIDGVAQNPLTVSTKGGTWTSPVIQGPTTIEIAFVGVPVYDIPYLYDFTDAAHFDEYTVYPHPTATYRWLRNTTVFPSNPIGYITYNAALNENYMITPPLNLDPTKNYILKYKLGKSSSTYTEVIRSYIGLANNASILAAPQITETSLPGNAGLGANPWVQVEVSIPQSGINPTGPSFIGFNRDYNMYNLYIDDIEITEALPTTVTLTVGPNGTATNLGVNDVAIGTSFTTVITPDDGYIIESILIDGVPESPLTVSAKGGTWTLPNVQVPTIVEITFTEVQPYPVPYYFGWEDLDAVSNGDAEAHFADAWTVRDFAGSTTWIRYNDGGNYTARIQYTSPPYNNDWMMTPPIQLDPTKMYKISYSYKTGSMAETFDVKFGTSTSDTTTYTNLVTHADYQNATWAKEILTIPSSAIPANGMYYVAFKMYTPGNRYYVYIDSVLIEEAIPTTVTLTVGPNGTATNLGVNDVVIGGSFSTMITPDGGYAVSSISVDGVELDPLPISAKGGVYTYTNVQGPTTIDITFEALPVYEVPYYFGWEDDDALALDPPSATATAHFTDDWTRWNGTGSNHWIRSGSGTAYYAYISYNNPSNDWMITPPIHLEPTKLYSLSYSWKTAGAYGGHNEMWDVTMGTSNAIAGQDVILQSFDIINQTWQKEVIDLNPADYTTEGSYFFGWHAMSIDVYNISIDSVSIEEVPTAVITATTNTGDGIDPIGVTVVKAGLDVTYIFTTPTSPCHTAVVDSVFVDDVLIQNPGTEYTFTNIAAGSHTIHVVFARVAYTINASSGANGLISPAGISTVYCGDNATYNFVPNSGYTVARIIVDGNSIAYTGTNYTFINVTANHTINVEFEVSTVQLTVTATAGANGTISPIGTFPVSVGSSVDFTITPYPTYEIDQLRVNGVVQPIASDATTYTLSNIVSNMTVNVTFKKIVYQVNVTYGPNGSVTPSGIIEVPQGDNLMLALSPATNYRVLSITKDGITVPESDYANNYYQVVNVQSAVAIHVLFAPIEYTITASAIGGGAITPSGTFAAIKDEVITFTISSADPSKEFVRLLVNDISVPVYNNTYELIVEGNTTLVAEFATKRFTINAAADGGGVINPDGNILVEYGNSAIFTFGPLPGYVFDKLLVDDIETSSNGVSYTFTDVESNHTILALFKIFVGNTYVISAATDGNGIINPVGDIVISEGGSQTFTFTPNFGYQLEGVFIDDDLVITPNNMYEFNNVMSNHTIFVKFAPNMYKIDIDEDVANGRIDPNGIYTLPYNANQLITFIPDADYVLGRALVNGKQVPTYNNTYTLVVTEDAVVTAEFRKIINEVTITATSGANGTISPIGDVIVTIGSDKLFTFTPNAGYEVEEVLVDGVKATFTGNTYEFTNIQTDHTIHVSFKALPTFEITALAGPNGTITPSGVLIVPQGGNQLFVFTPANQYLVEHVSINGVVLQENEYPNNQYEFTNVQADALIYVTFIFDVGIEDVENSLISVHPNPTSGSVMLSHEGIEIDRLEVLNLTGSLVLEFTNVTDEIDLSKLPNGTYTLRFHTKAGVETHRIVKVN
ncbi:MAG: choice-of-anchor J domain-containing protein [Ignavibacteria bacterium]|jgi:hypothetical protein|nr:choice-of-anchor J domain-containing protein [Ignavibacteria bacterium]